MEIEQKFYVYVDYREDDGKPFYVGKGIEKRVKDLDRNHLHERIKGKHGLVRKILFETYSEQEAFQKETELILELRTHVDFDEGGANFTFGGDGTSGYKWNEEQRKNIGKINKKNWEAPGYVEKMRNIMIESYKNESIRKRIGSKSKERWEDPEQKEKMLAAMKLGHNTPEGKKNHSEARKKLWEDPEFREKTIESLKRFWDDPDKKEELGEKIKEALSDPEIRKKISESKKKYWDDPENKKKTSENISNALLNNPEARKKISEAKKKCWDDPEYKKKAGESMKKAHEKRTPEQKKEIIKKAWETRRLKKLQEQVKEE